MGCGGSLLPQESWRSQSDLHLSLLMTQVDLLQPTFHKTQTPRAGNPCEGHGLDTSLPSTTSSRNLSQCKAEIAVGIYPSPNNKTLCTTIHQALTCFLCVSPLFSWPQCLTRNIQQIKGTWKIMPYISTMHRYVTAGGTVR